MSVEELKTKADRMAIRAGKIEGEQADRLYKRAGKTYLQALAENPEYFPALNAWAAALIAQARSKPPEEAAELFDLAADKLHQAEVISPGSGSYNLACIAALRGMLQECRKWLENGPRHGIMPCRQMVLTDPDLEAVRDENWFRAFLGKIEE